MHRTAPRIPKVSRSLGDLLRVHQDSPAKTGAMRERPCPRAHVANSRGHRCAPWRPCACRRHGAYIVPAPESLADCGQLSRRHSAKLTSEGAEVSRIEASSTRASRRRREELVAAHWPDFAASRCARIGAHVCWSARSALENLVCGRPLREIGPSTVHSPQYDTASSRGRSCDAQHASPCPLRASSPESPRPPHSTYHPIPQRLLQPPSTRRVRRYFPSSQTDPPRSSPAGQSPPARQLPHRRPRRAPRTLTHTPARNGRHSPGEIPQPIKSVQSSGNEFQAECSLCNWSR